jgi:hypothetical protein
MDSCVVYGDTKRHHLVWIYNRDGIRKITAKHIRKLIRRLMARKAFKSGAYTLYITTSIGGMIKTQLVDKLTREEVEQNYYTSLSPELEDYLTSVGVSVIKVSDYLKAN